MTREPLMLSDTAMVLLKRSFDASSYVQSVTPVLGVDPDSHRYVPGYVRWFPEGLHPFLYDREIRDVNRALVYEVWLLWTFPDIPITRGLEWHLSFNNTLMLMAENTFLPVEQVQHGTQTVTLSRKDGVRFISALHFAYREALEALC
jgi:hypothetical protein